MAPLIKVIANSFLIQGLLSLFFGQLFWNFLAFLNLWDPTTADSYLVFENPSTHCWGMRKIVGFFWWKMSNQGFQRAIFNFFQFPWRFSPGLQFFYNFLSKMGWIISKWPEIVKIFLWWPNLASELSNPFQL